MGAAGALVSMVGDLAASAVKRDHEIKDYGKLIPGPTAPSMDFFGLNFGVILCFPISTPTQ